MKHIRTSCLCFLLSLFLLPAGAQTDRDTLDPEEDLAQMEAAYRKWDTRARETLFPEEKEQVQALASQYEKLIALRKELTAAFGSKRIPLEKRLERMRERTLAMEEKVNENFPPPNPFPDSPFPVGDSGEDAVVPPSEPPASYKTESGFEIRLRLVD